MDFETFNRNGHLEDRNIVVIDFQCFRGWDTFLFSQNECDEGNIALEVDDEVNY